MKITSMTKEEIEKKEQFKKDVQEAILKHYDGKNASVTIQSMTLNFYLDDEKCQYIWEF